MRTWFSVILQGDQWVFVVGYNYSFMDLNMFDVFQFISVIFASESLFLFVEFFEYNSSGFW